MFNITQEYEIGKGNPEGKGYSGEEGQEDGEKQLGV